MNEIKELKEEIARLRERIAVLESRANQPVRDGYPLWQPYTPDRIAPPYIVTC